MKTYNLEEDHEAIKKQIKKWEKKLNELMKDEDCNRYISEELETISQEMMSINI